MYDKKRVALASYYQIVGVLLPSNPQQTSVTEGAECIENNLHISCSDWRRVAIGLLPEDMVNTDVDGSYAYNELYATGTDMPMTYLNDVLFYGTLMHVETQITPIEDLFVFDVDTILAGRTNYIRAGSNYVRWRRPAGALVKPSTATYIGKYLIDLLAGERIMKV